MEIKNANNNNIDNVNSILYFNRPEIQEISPSVSDVIKYVINSPNRNNIVIIATVSLNDF